MTQDSHDASLTTEATTGEIVEKLEDAFKRLASELGVPVAKVRNIARRRYVRLQMSEREDQIVKLREEGKTNEEISEALGLSLPTINKTVSKLIGEGRVASQKGAGTAFWYNLQDERVQTIIKAVKERATLQEMSDVIGCTKEWVRQLIGFMKDIHGEGIFTSEEALWIPQEAADELGVNANIIYYICRSGKIPTRRRSVNENGAFLISEEGMRLLRVHPLVTHERMCAVCGKIFVYEHKSGSRNVCSDKCLEEYNNQRHEAYAEHEPTLETLKWWRKDLWQKLQTHRIPKKEEWLTISEAFKRTGLSYMQLTWLRHRNIVTMRPHPKKKWRGRPVMMYSASEMEIARQVCETYEQQKSAKD